MKKTLRIVSRKSALALWQAEFVKQKLQSLYPDLNITIMGVDTEGDKNLSSSLAKIGGKGLFVKALEECLLDNQADIAVHSLKDVPAVLPKTLEIGVILKRDDPRDAFISNRYTSLKTLPPNAIIGTSSLRRQSQLYALRPDLQTKMLRGNVDTRIQKLDRGEYDAMILAAAGLKRLDLSHRIQMHFSPEDMLPAVGQGALAIECRIQDAVTQKFIKALHHPITAYCVSAERAFNANLGGGCQLPVACYAEIDKNGLLTLQGFVGSPDGKQILKAKTIGKKETGLDMGKQVADQLLALGAQDIIDACLL